MRGGWVGGLVLADPECPGMCQGLFLGWDTMTSGYGMGGCVSIQAPCEIQEQEKTRRYNYDFNTLTHFLGLKPVSEGQWYRDGRLKK